MKHQNGFTLIELLAVIIILAVILIIAVPAIGRAINKSREDSIKADIKMMEVSARNYVSKTGEYTPDNEGDTELIPLKVLIQKGYISKIIYPDKNKTECDGAVKVTKEGKKYKYEGYLNCGVYLSDNINEIYEELKKKVEEKVIEIIKENEELLPDNNDSVTYDINEDLNLEIEDPMDPENNEVIGDVTINHGDEITGEGTIVEINGETYEIVADIDVKDENDDYVYKDGEVGGSDEEEEEEEEEIVNADKTGANPPKLPINMIPVKYDETTKKWIKADVTNAAGPYQWYDYGFDKEGGIDSSIWANGVMVKSNVRNEYLQAAPGTEIVFDNILQFYVWIPRYKYRIESNNFHKTTPGLIDVKFEKGTAITGMAVVDATTGFPAGEYLTHPAFCVTNNDDNGDGKLSTYLGDDCTDEGDWNLEGFWIGKFEVSYNAGFYRMIPTINSNNVKNHNYHYATFLYNLAKALNDNNNGYGFIEATDDTHLIKSSEWGAVAYLSHSTYGRGNSPVWVNNSSEALIGCSGNSARASYNNNYYNCSYDYNHATYGGQSSTTGNIYGIYDMAGGSAEYTAATKLENNSFNKDIYNDRNTKYVDNLGDMPGTLALNNTIGMAMYETSSSIRGNYGWYSDYVEYTPASSLDTYPVVVRGIKGMNFQNAGIFSYYVYEGYENYDITWRPSLVVK